METPSGVAESIAEPPPERSAMTRSPSPAHDRRSMMPHAAARLPSSGIGCPASIYRIGPSSPPVPRATARNHEGTLPPRRGGLEGPLQVLLARGIHVSVPSLSPGLPSVQTKHSSLEGIVPGFPPFSCRGAASDFRKLERPPARAVLVHQIQAALLPHPLPPQPHHPARPRA